MFCVTFFYGKTTPNTLSQCVVLFLNRAAEYDQKINNSVSNVNFDFSFLFGCFTRVFQRRGITY
ncbi:hypothetical protein DESC_700164 [Desulfosarcina cetonica]|nr:hypothetical protein DESC_700164 [Desulfosarcina cetonica]